MEGGEGIHQEGAQVFPLPHEGVVADISGGEWPSAVFGNQYHTSSVVNVYPEHGAVHPSVEGMFKLGPGIIVYEKSPISLESRIYRGKLLSKVLGDRDIAIKLLLYGERQIREAKIHFLVPHHENIVERIFTDTFSYRGQKTIYIAMERCDDQNLHEYVLSQASSGVPFDPTKYLSFSFQVANGMHFLHCHNIMNRDVKPDNLLLSCNKTKVKISDFGLSKQMAPDRQVATQSIPRAGTDGWRAPEVLNKSERVSKKSDIYPMGLIFNFLWSYGKHPFGDDQDSWNHYIKRGENRNLDQLLIANPDLAKGLLEWMLKMDPDERPTTEQILMHPIFRGLATFTDPDIRAAVEEALATMGNGGVSAEGNGRVNLSKGQLYAVVKEVVAKAGTARRVPMERTESREDEPIGPDAGYWNLPRDEVIVDKRVAEGGYSEVWKGHFKKDVAIKKCNLNVFSKERLSVEAKTLKSLRHENIIKLIGMITGRPFMVVFEFTEYGSLSYFLTSGEGKNSTMKQQCIMATQIASGMAYVEKKKFIHRLLRARFIMVGKNRVCKIATFGRSRYLDDAGECRIALDECDSVVWMAPETMDEHRYSIKTDVWSFGILLSEILTKGHIPYPDWTDEELMARIKNDYRMPKQPNWPQRIYDEIMLPCWRREPQDRPSFAWLENFLLANFTD